MKMKSLELSILICLLAPITQGAEFQGSQLAALPGSVGMQTLTISENAAGTVMLQRTATEAATVIVTLMTVEDFTSRSTSPPGSCMATLPSGFSASASSAIAGADFTSGDISVSFVAGETTQSVAIGALDDDIAEAVEVFVAVIASPNAMTNCALLVQIRDNDVVTIGFSAAEFMVDVDPPRTVTDIRLVKTGSHADSFLVSIALSSGTETGSIATENEDYSLSVTNFTFQSNTFSIEFPVMVMDPDSVGERAEVIPLCISIGSAVFNITAVQQCTRILLLDDDVTTVGFVGLAANPQYELTEGEQTEICVGVKGPLTIPLPGFVELDVALIPRLQGTDSRLERTPYVNFLFTIGPTPDEIQLADGFAEACYTATAVDNDIVDGDVFYNMTIAPAGPTLSLMLPVEIDYPQATIIVRDNDRNNFSVTLESTNPGTDPSVHREGTQQAVTIPYILRREGLPTELTYLITLGTVHEADFIFEPIRFGPSSTSQPLSLLINDDTTPEPRERFTITIQSVGFADGRQGMLPQFTGTAEVEIYDNDFAVGFNVSELRVTEGSAHTLVLRILDPTGTDIDPEATLPLTLVLQRLDSPSDDTLVTLDISSVQLSSARPSVTVTLTVGDDDVCSAHRYMLSYTYTGSSAYTVLNSLRGQVDLELMDTAEDCATTAMPTTTMSTTTMPTTTMPTVSTSEESTPSVTPSDRMTTSDAGRMTTRRGGRPGTKEPLSMTTSDETGTKVGSTEKSREQQICIPCIVIPIVLVLVLCCCFWWLLIIFCFLCKPKRCRWYHDYDPQKKERAYEAVVELDGKMIPVTEAT